MMRYEHEDDESHGGIRRKKTTVSLRDKTITAVFTGLPYASHTHQSKELEVGKRYITREEQERRDALYNRKSNS